MIELITKKFVPLANWDRGVILTPRGKELWKGSPLRPLTSNDLKEGLKKFNDLPESERKSGESEIGAEIKEWCRKESRHAHPATPPEGGLVLKEYLRYLSVDAQVRLHPTQMGGINEPQLDYMWLKEEEWKSLVPRNPKRGESFPAPPFFTDRLWSNQVFDPCFGANYYWQFPPGRKPAVTFTVTEASAELIRLDVNGAATMDGMKIREMTFDFGYRLRGVVEYDLRKQAFRRFDMAILGEFANPNASMAAYLRTQAPDGHARRLGYYFEIGRANSPLERVRPGAMELGNYFEFRTN